MWGLMEAIVNTANTVEYFNGKISKVQRTLKLFANR